jgi:hypothetical protein
MQSHRSHRKIGRIAVAVAMAALAAGIAAAKGPKGKYQPTGYEQCGATPNPVTNGSGYTLVGTNFPAGMGVTVYVADQVATWTYKATVAVDGTFSISQIANFSSTPANMYVNRTGDRKFLTWCTNQFGVISQ